MPEKQYISKITLPNGQTYEIKDQEARDLIAGIAAGGLAFKVSQGANTTPYGITWTDNETVITGTLVASSDTKAYIYLVPHIKNAQGAVDFYREYVTVDFGTEQSHSYAWEFLGDTDIDLSGLGALAWKNAATGTIKVTTADSGSFSNGTVSASASYTPEGSVAVTLNQTQTNASLTKGNYTPEGTISKPNVTVTPTTASIDVKKTAGTVSAGTAASFTQGTDQYTAPTLTTTVDENETLTIGFTAGSFTQGSDSFSANTPTSVTLPTFESKTVMTGASAELAAAPTFTGTTAENALVTGVKYDKATVNSAGFTGTAATISSTGTASGDVTLTKTEKDINVSVS